MWRYHELLVLGILQASNLCPHQNVCQDLQWQAAEAA
jgi:hypothetical protein